MATGAARRHVDAHDELSRAALERELARRNVVKATVMRHTLHLVTWPDYALLRAALSETNFPWQSALAERLAPSVRALAAVGPITMAEGIEHLEREHGLTGIDGRRAWQAARVRAHVVHDHETALWHARPEGRFVCLDQPAAHDPTEARARSSAATSPRSAPQRVATSSPGA